MITTCTICQARYQLDGTKVPQKIIRVRCPACSGVFVLDGTAPPLVTDYQMETPDTIVAPEPEVSTSFATDDSFAPDFEDQRPAEVEESGLVDQSDTWDIPEVSPDIAANAPGDMAADFVDEVVPPIEAAPAAVVAPPAPKTRRRRSKEEMLARALVSDILVYNRDLRDTAIKDGKLLEVLGGEIKKSWELYKEKVTPDVANSTNHFREALNEILAEGEKVF